MNQMVWYVRCVTSEQILHSELDFESPLYHVWCLVESRCVQSVSGWTWMCELGVVGVHGGHVCRRRCILGNGFLCWILHWHERTPLWWAHSRSRVRSGSAISMRLRFLMMPGMKVAEWVEDILSQDPAHFFQDHSPPSWSGTEVYLLWDENR